MDRDSVSIRDHDYGVRIAVLEERWKGRRLYDKEYRRNLAQRDKDYRKYIERRLDDLNGEAGRLKTILDNSVPLTTFNNYVNTQRDRADEAARSNREHFDAYAASQSARQEEYQRTQANAFKVYVDEMAKWRSSINVRLATWIGGAIVALTVLELVLRQKI
jgi:hypothetical protein